MFLQLDVTKFAMVSVLPFDEYEGLLEAASGHSHQVAGPSGIVPEPSFATLPRPTLFSYLLLIDTKGKVVLVLTVCHPLPCKVGSK